MIKYASECKPYTLLITLLRAHIVMYRSIHMEQDSVDPSVEGIACPYITMYTRTNMHRMHITQLHYTVFVDYNYRNYNA